MENPKLIKFLIPIFVLGFFVVGLNNVFAYGIETHAYLTSEVIEFYNQKFSGNKIPDDLKNYLLDGSRREDNIPRWMNHFYDPVYNRGLTDSVLGTWQKSKDWAQDGTHQISALYNPILNTTLADFYAVADPGKLKETDFSWQRAITDYVNGNQKRAFYSLGHILHLIEDASVPDHTRNDPHPGDSPYENYTQKFTLSNPDADFNKKLSNKSPVIFSDLNSYFDELAKYSNNNFYSKDRVGIQSGYQSPQPDYFKLGKDGYSYGFKIDNEFGDYSLLQAKGVFAWASDGTELINFPVIMEDYWSRLSTKSVQYGAGVINLFFQEVEKAKNDPNFVKTKEKSLLGKVIDSTKSFFAQVGSTVSGIFGKDDGFKPAGQISLSQPQAVQSTGQAKTDETQKTEPLSASTQTSNQTPSQASSQIQKLDSSKNIRRTSAEEEENLPFQQPEIQQTTTSTLQQTTSTQQQITKPTTTFKECSFNNSQSPSRQKVIINEVAWMGGLSDFSLTYTDEWFELKNISNAEVNLNGWQILDKSEKIKIIFDGAAKISANGFYLLERTNDNSVPNVSANLTYSGTLNNSDEGLRLFDNNCNLIDEVLTNSGSDSKQWPAGDNDQKRTMERSPDGSTSLTTGLSWHTYNGTAQNSIFGTPKKENSAPTVIYSGGSSGTPSSNQQPTTNDQQQTAAKILINEIQLSPTGNRFIELYNPNNSSVNLTNWYLQRKTQTGSSFGSLVSKTYFEGKTINANDYFLISRASLDGADIILDNLTLTESNVIQLKNSDGEVIDKLGWGQASDCEGSCALQPSDNQSI